MIDKKGSDKKMENIETENKVCENYISGCRYLYPEMEIEEDKFGIRPKECPFRTLHCGWFPDSANVEVIHNTRDKLFICKYQGEEITLDPLNYSCSAGELADVLDVLPGDTLRELAEFSGPLFAQAVREWDQQHVEDLIQLIQFSDCILQAAGMQTEDYIDTSALPSVPHPDLYDGFKIWCMDKQGKGLVGPSMDDIEMIQIQEVI